MIVFLFISLIVISLFITILTTAKLKIVIKKIEIKNLDDAIKMLNILIYEKNDIAKLNFLDYLKFDIKIKVIIFEKLPILIIKLDNNKLKNIMKNQYTREIKKHKDIEKEKKKAKEISKKLVRVLTLKKSNLDIHLGTEDAAFTAIISSLASILISIILPYIVDIKKYKYHNYKITPIYLNKNVFFLQFSCIITSKILHIIKVMCKNKQGGIIYE